MINFYINDMIPKCDDRNILKDCFCNLINNYIKINPNYSKKIIRTTDIIAGNNIFDFLSILPREIKILSYKLLEESRYPENISDEILENEYYTIIDENKIKGCYSYAASTIDNGFLLTCAIIDSLKENILYYYDLKDIRYNTQNFYGNNLVYINKILYDREVNSLPLLNQIKIRYDAVLHPNFERFFKTKDINTQNSIMNSFNEAKKYNFEPEGNALIKGTGGSSQNKVYEIRIFEPTKIRIYFSFLNNKLFIINMGYANTQDRDIRFSHQKIDDFVDENL